MIELKKTDLEGILLTISVFSQPKEGEQQRMIGGLLTEEVTLGTKRNLQKIHKVAMEAYKEYVEDIKKLVEECKEDKEKLEIEFKVLQEENVKLEVEPIKLSFLENVSTKNNYNFDLIDKFAV